LVAAASFSISTAYLFINESNITRYWIAQEFGGASANPFRRRASMQILLFPAK